MLNYGRGPYEPVELIESSTENIAARELPRAQFNESSEESVYNFTPGAIQEVSRGRAVDPRGHYRIRQLDALCGRYTDYLKCGKRFVPNAEISLRYGG
ncbi:hypothetical protein ACOME3_010111 [Neoechinorhynchus agilis]